MTEERDKKTRNAKILAVVKTIVKNIPSILLIVYWICVIVIIKDMIPYLKGEEVMENAFTTSQLTAYFVIFLLFGAGLYISNKVKGIK